MCFLGSDAHANAFFFSLPVLCSQEHQEERRANLPPSLHKLTVHIQKFVMTCSALHCSAISHNMTAQVQIPGFFFSSTLDMHFLQVRRYQLTLPDCRCP